MQKWPDHVVRIIQLALDEDIGKGDITTNAIYTGKEKGFATLIAKENGILSGITLASFIVQYVSDRLLFTSYLQDGDSFSKGETLARIEGPLAPLLTAERTLLNFLQRMSGIATLTRKYVKVLEPYDTRIMDTRKTAPGLRYLDKMAVSCGGGVNHRIRLDDRFLIKENHIRMAGSISDALNLCQAYRKKNQLDAAIEIEVTSLGELESVITCGGADYVMLDNMSIPEMKRAVQWVNKRFFTEASGNVTLEKLPEIAETGVDFISAGALTHSVPALDISLLIREKSE